MPSTKATARSSVLSSESLPKRFYKGGGKKAQKAKSGNRSHQPYQKRQNNDYPKQNELLHRLSLPPSSPSGPLLERIGGSVEDEAVSSTLTSSDRIDGERVSQGVDTYSNVPLSGTPHFYTPEPGEVERFLESAIGSPLIAPARSDPVHTCSGSRPAVALQTHNLPVDHLVSEEDPPSSVSYSPTQTAVNSLPSATFTLDHCDQQSPLLDDTMAPPSTSTIEECRKNLVPVLLASAQARGPGYRLDSEQCLELLSDDQCRSFFWQAKEMKRQLSASLASQKTPVNQGGSLKRDRVDDVDAWVRSTRSRFSSTNTVVSEVSRRDSDITMADFTGGRLPPKVPRAMLQASHATLIKSAESAQDEVSYELLQVTSPTTEDRPPSSTPLIDLVHQAIKMLPTLMPTNQPVAEINTSNVSAGEPTGGHPSLVVSPAHPVSADFVSHLPTQPGIWFKQPGRRYAEIVDVDIEVSDKVFYMSRERQPTRLRMHLRLCSVPVGVLTQNNNDDTLAWLKDDRSSVAEHHALHWPKKGKLVVQINPESVERSKTWLPHNLESDPLDVTSCIHPGKNTFRFIQLSDLSEFTFLLVASPPPPEEEWRSWDWASLTTRSSSTDDPTNDLSDFAHLPVNVRS